jgi:hypothetical protein
MDADGCSGKVRRPSLLIHHDDSSILEMKKGYGAKEHLNKGRSTCNTLVLGACIGEANALSPSLRTFYCLKIWLFLSSCLLAAIYLTLSVFGSCSNSGPAHRSLQTILACIVVGKMSYRKQRLCLCSYCCRVEYHSMPQWQVHAEPHEGLDIPVHLLMTDEIRH